jgi:NAD(P)H-dependent nitrite reductase small subunit
MSLELEGFQKVCKVNELKDKTGKRFFVDDVEVAVFKVNGNVFALSNICPHQKVHLIYDGYVDGETVICPIHGWQFQLKDGTVPSGGRGLESYEVKIFNDDVFIKVIKKELKW